MSIEDRLRASLRRRADAVRPSEALKDRIGKHHGNERVHARHRIGVAAVAIGVAAVSFAFVVRAFWNEPSTRPRPGNIGSPSDPPSPEPSERPEPSPPPPNHLFIPKTRLEGDVEVLPVTFPDGSTAELAYPRALSLADLGVTPYMAGCGHDFGFTHYDPRGVKYYGEPLEEYNGTSGRVRLYPSVKGWGGVDFLMFHFGEWWIDLYQYRHERPTLEGRRDCAENLRGTVTDDGWVVLSGPPSLGLNGAELEIGGLGPDRRLILLFPEQCENVPVGDDTTTMNGIHVEKSRDFADWCDPSGVRIHLYFEPGSGFFEDVFEGLDIRDARFAS